MKENLLPPRAPAAEPAEALRAEAELTSPDKLVTLLPSRRMRAESRTTTGKSSSSGFSSQGSVSARKSSVPPVAMPPSLTRLQPWMRSCSRHGWQNCPLRLQPCRHASHTSPAQRAASGCGRRGGAGGYKHFPEGGRSGAWGGIICQHTSVPHAAVVHPARRRSIGRGLVGRGLQQPLLRQADCFVFALVKAQGERWRVPIPRQRQRLQRHAAVALRAERAGLTTEEAAE